MTSATSRPESPTARGLYAGLLAGPVVWSVHFLSVYALVEAACRAGTQAAPGLPPALLAGLIVGLTLLALAATAFSGWRAYRQWRALEAYDPSSDWRAAAASPDGGDTDAERRTDRARTAERSGFMALSGVMLSGLFSLAILLAGIPILVLSPCAWS